MKTETVLPLSSSELPILKNQTMSDRVSFAYSEDCHNPVTYMHFAVKGNNDNVENHFQFKIEKKELQTLFEECEVIKNKIDKLVL